MFAYYPNSSFTELHRKSKMFLGIAHHSRTGNLFFWKIKTSPSNFPFTIRWQANMIILGSISRTFSLVPLQMPLQISGYRNSMTIAPIFKGSSWEGSPLTKRLLRNSIGYTKYINWSTLFEVTKGPGSLPTILLLISSTLSLVGYKILFLESRPNGSSKNFVGYCQFQFNS